MIRLTAPLKEAVASPNREAKLRSNVKAIETYLATINKSVKTYAQAVEGGSKDWGYIGNLGHIAEVLGDLAVFCGGRKINEDLESK